MDTSGNQIWLNFWETIWVTEFFSVFGISSQSIKKIIFAQTCNVENKIWAANVLDDEFVNSLSNLSLAKKNWITRAKKTFLENNFCSQQRKPKNNSEILRSTRAEIYRFTPQETDFSEITSARYFISKNSHFAPEMKNENSRLKSIPLASPMSLVLSVSCG